jgi:hypothetical protein
MKKIYLVCNYDGMVEGYSINDSFDEAYDDTITSNNGEFLVELTSENIEYIIKLYDEIKEDK